MGAHVTRESASSGSEPTNGGAELWLVGIGAGAALIIAAFVAALTEARGLTAVRDVMWTLTFTGVCILLLCLAGYLSERR